LADRNRVPVLPHGLNYGEWTATDRELTANWLESPFGKKLLTVLEAQVTMHAFADRDYSEREDGIRQGMVQMLRLIRELGSIDESEQEQDAD